MTDWNFADVWDRISAVRSAAPAVVQGDRRVSWTEFADRATQVSGALRQATASRPEPVEGQRKVALYLFNGPEYLEILYAAFRARMVPVNANFRFGVEELTYLCANADAEIVFFDSSLAATAEGVRVRLAAVHTWVCVGGPVPDWAVDYETWAASGLPDVVESRRGDDVFMLYTGGTTGMPKGVEWRQDDMFCNLNATALHRFPEGARLDDVAGLLPARSTVHLAACPLMHGAGSITSMSALSQGGTVVLLSGRSFSPVELLDAVASEQVTTIALTGDAIARPVVDALDLEPDRWDLSSLVYIVSSAVTWSDEVKERLRRHCPDVRLVDTLGASEGMGVGRSVTGGSGSSGILGNFLPGRHTRVLDEAGRPVEPGTGTAGMLVVGGRQPLRYYADPVRSAEVWRVIRGQRYALTGDYARVEVDGSITLLGRGSSSINTGGEKVYPGEVEAVLRTHPDVRDVAVVGRPDDRFGEVVVAVVQAVDGTSPTQDDLAGHVKKQLSGFKAPRHVVLVPQVARLANGKLDYARLRDVATS